MIVACSSSEGGPLASGRVLPLGGVSTFLERSQSPEYFSSKIFAASSLTRIMAIAFFGAVADTRTVLLKVTFATQGPRGGCS